MDRRLEHRSNPWGGESIDLTSLSSAKRFMADSRMPESRKPSADDVDQLMLNAQLRNELEPFLDESLDVVDRHRMTTRHENEYLASMLAWERAPVCLLYTSDAADE